MDPFKLHQLVRQTSLAQSLDTLGYAATLTNTSDEFVYANSAFENMYGWRERELIGLKPMILVPQNYSHAHMASLRKKISIPGSSWVGVLPNRHKDGVVFEIELATFQIPLMGSLPANLVLGIAARVGEIRRAVNEMTATLCRVLFQQRMPVVNGFKQLKRHEQVESLVRHGYSMKEIATFLGVDLNTPYVILHRAKRKKT